MPHEIENIRAEVAKSFDLVSVYIELLYARDRGVTNDQVIAAIERLDVLREE